MPDFSKFECDRCGACCNTLIVEAGYYDALREPKLFQLGGEDSVDLDKLRSGQHVVMLYNIQTNACPFLDGETHACGIYPTRPMCCVAVEAGDAKCQQARRMKALDLLKDRDGQYPSVHMLQESCEEYDKDLDDFFPEYKTEAKLPQF